MQFGSLVATIMFVCIGYRIKLSMVDYDVILLLWVRIAITFLVFYLIESGHQSFALIDPKQMNDSISILFPAICGTFCNWKFNLLISAPLIIIFSALAA